MNGATARKPWWRRWFGSRAERAAARFLRGLGWHIVRRNYTCPHGEIDLVAVEDRTVVFVEVRSSSIDEQRAAESVDEIKQRRLTRLALYFLQEQRLMNHAARLDVLTVTWPDGQREPHIVHYRQAFEAVGRFQMHS